MTKTSTWIRAIRAPFLLSTALPLIIGMLFAFSQGAPFVWPFFLLAIVGSLLLHAGVNLANDYYDHISGNDAANKTPTPFSGGSRVIQEGLLQPEQIFKGALFCFAVALFCGLILNYVVPKNILIALGVIGLFLGLLYTAPPFKFAYRGLGELAVTLAFGPVLVGAGYYLFAHEITATALFLSIPIGLLTALILLANEFADIKADKKVGKNNLVVLLGPQAASLVYIVVQVFTYVFFVALIAFDYLNTWLAIALVTFFLGLKNYHSLIHNLNEPAALIPAMKGTIGQTTLFELLLIVGILLSVFI